MPTRRRMGPFGFDTIKTLKVAVCLLDDSGRSQEERVRVGNKGKSLIPSPKGGVLVG